MKQIMKKLQGERDKPTIIAGDLNNSLSITDISINDIKIEYFQST